MIQYKASFGRIEEIEVVSETAKTVTVKLAHGGERRQSKNNSYKAIFKTRAEAKNWILETKTSEVERAKRNLLYATSELEAALKL